MKEVSFLGKSTTELHKTGISCREKITRVQGNDFLVIMSDEPSAPPASD